ncbi:MAG TPA: DUF2884 family protein [Luteimonas sp.]|nr:DUF2884 family protein [Luteimonas sp.]
MNAARSLAFALTACLPLLGACGRHDQPPARPANGAPHSAIGAMAGKTMDKMRTRMETHNLTLSNDDDRLPRAEITPRGDLLIDGKAVAVDDAQRALLLAYRGKIIDVATAGADIGMQGADFGMQAAGKALRGAFSGNGDQVEKEIQAQAREFEQRARRICDHLPPLLETQRQLAAQLPEFKPYATMDQSDVDDCRRGD